LAGYKSVSDQAQKILGDKARIPKISPAILKANKDSDTAFSKFQTIVKQLESAILDLQNAGSAVYNSAKQFSEQISKSDFDMDTKADDYKKKRADAQKLFDIFFKDSLKDLQSGIKDLDELDQHLMDLKGYKSPPDPMQA
jgi:exonuclease VII small subunit